MGKVMEKYKELPFVTKLGMKSGTSLAFGLLLGYVLFPVILKYQVKKEMSLRNKTDMKEMWETLPFPLEFKVWLWNLSNPLEVHKGAKPIIKEVGPYVYDRWIEKLDLEENSEEDSIEFNMKNTYIFRPDLSDGLTGDEMIYTPHLLMMGTALYTVREKPSMLKLVAKALNGIYKNPPNIFPLSRVGDLLFDGIKIGCNTTEFAPKAVCTAYKEVSTLSEYEPGFFKYSYFGLGNGTNPKRFKVLRGIKNITEVGKVIEYDGKKAMETWSGEHCNRIEGTDTTIFRPFLTELDEIWTFGPEICRSIGAHYVEKTSYRGIKGLRYTLDFGDLMNERENHCFCRSSETCPPRGIMEITKCTEGPLALSLPHMYKVDPAVQNGLIGQNPEKEKHEIILDFEPISGTPLFVKKRVQLNIIILNIPQMELFSTVADGYIPIAWIEETLALNKTFIRMLNMQLFYPAKAVALIKWSTILGGLVGGIAAMVIKFRNRESAFGRPNATAPADAEAPGSNPNSADSHNNQGLTPLEKDNAPLPGEATRY